MVFQKLAWHSISSNQNQVSPSRSRLTGTFQKPLSSRQSEPVAPNKELQQSTTMSFPLARTTLSHFFPRLVDFSLYHHDITACSPVSHFSVNFFDLLLVLEVPKPVKPGACPCLPIRAKAQTVIAQINEISSVEIPTMMS